MRTELLLLWAAFCVMATAPLIPALIHLLGTHGSALIDIPPDRNDDPRHFPKRLLAIVQREPANSQRLLFIDDTNNSAMRELLSASPDTRIAIVSPGVALPPATQWLGDMLARGDIEIPSDSTLRTLRCEGLCLVHPEAKVLRWLDARAAFIMGPARLPPRTTASQKISLSTGIEFERLHAPLIEILPMQPVDKATDDTDTLPALPPEVEIWRLEADEEWVAGHKLFEADAYICSNSAVSCDVVCRGDLHIGVRARIEGNIKVKGDLFVHSQATIQGHVMCEGSVTFDPACKVDGVITTLQHLSIAGQCVLGTDTTPTSLIADTMTLHSGVCIHGQVWARHAGQTHV